MEKSRDLQARALAAKMLMKRRRAVLEPILSKMTDLELVNLAMTGQMPATASEGNSEENHGKVS
jgi:hypothetical protein